MLLIQPECVPLYRAYSGDFYPWKIQIKLINGASNKEKTMFRLFETNSEAEREQPASSFCK